MELLRTLRYARRFRNWREIGRARAAGTPPPRAVLWAGPRFDAPPDVNPARMVNGVFFKQVYTPPGFEIAEGDVVVDVGANIGVFSVFAALASRAPLLAIEPFPANADHLERNLAANGCDTATVLRGALSDHEGSTKLFLGRKGVVHQIFDRADDGGQLQDHIEVPTTTLEAALDAHGFDRVDLLKLDCEGAEGLVLGSASPGLFARVRRITMEFHDYVSPLHHDALGKLLESHGYSTRLVWNGRSHTGFLHASRA